MDGDNFRKEQPLQDRPEQLRLKLQGKGYQKLDFDTLSLHREHNRLQ